MDGHKIANENIELSYKHAEQIEEQGQRLGRVGALLSGGERFTQQEIEFIQEAAQQIRACARAMFEYTKLAESDEERSTQAFAAAVQQHAEAVKLHAEINRIFSK
jgi:hypothetical protein